MVLVPCGSHGRPWRVGQGWGGGGGMGPAGRGVHPCLAMALVRAWQGSREASAAMV